MPRRLGRLPAAPERDAAERLLDDSLAGEGVLLGANIVKCCLRGVCAFHEDYDGKRWQVYP